MSCFFLLSQWKERGWGRKKDGGEEEGETNRKNIVQVFFSCYCQGQNAIFTGSLVFSIVVIFMFPHVNFPKCSVINYIRKATFVFRSFYGTL